MNFRGYSVAATLKHFFEHQVDVYRPEFPRLFSRGHIEASYWRRNGSYRRGFPRLFSRGHIEAARREKK